MKLHGFALVLITVVALLASWQWASIVGPDVNNDGTVTVGDIYEVVRAFGQAVPTPAGSSTPASTPTKTATPSPTNTPTPTATPPPTTGGGAERVLAYHMVLQPTGSTTEIGAIDQTVCKHPFFLLAVRDTSYPNSQVEVYINGTSYAPRVGAEPWWRYILFTGSANEELVNPWPGGDLVHFAISNADTVEVILEVHCAPSVL